MNSDEKEIPIQKKEPAKITNIKSKINSRYERQSQIRKAMWVNLLFNTNPTDQVFLPKMEIFESRLNSVKGPSL